MSPKEFRDEGFLQEVNRQFFHPLGLALAVKAPHSIVEGPFTVEIWDERDDPEGWFFAEGEMSAEKARNVDDLFWSKVELRDKLLNHIWYDPDFSIQKINEFPDDERLKND